MPLQDHGTEVVAEKLKALEVDFAALRKERVAQNGGSRVLSLEENAKDVEAKRLVELSDQPGAWEGEA